MRETAGTQHTAGHPAIGAPLALMAWFAWTACVYLLAPVADLGAEGGRDVLAFIAGHVAFPLASALGMTLAVAFERAREANGRPPVMLFALAGALLACVGTACAPVLSGILSVGAFALAGLGGGLLCIACGNCLSMLDMAANMRAVPLALVAGVIVYLVISFLPAAAFATLPAMLPALCAGLLRVAQGRALPSQPSPSASPLPRRTISSTVYDRWHITLETSAYWFAFGFMWAVAMPFLFQADAAGRHVAYASTALVTILLCLVIMALAHLPGGNMVLTFWLFAPFFVVGIAALAVFGADAQPVFLGMLFAAKLSVCMQLVSHFAAVCRRGGYPPTLLFGRTFAVLSVAEALGVGVGLPCASLVPEWLSAALLAMLAFVICTFVVSVADVNAGFRRTEMERAARAARSEAARAASAAPEEIADLLSRSHALSARETEVAGLLLAGRTAPFIAERLGISLPTVNTHVRHIYEKVGVGSRQELIDLGERERGRA